MGQICCDFHCNKNVQRENNQDGKQRDGVEPSSSRRPVTELWRACETLPLWAVIYRCSLLPFKIIFLFTTCKSLIIKMFFIDYLLTQDFRMLWLSLQKKKISIQIQWDSLWPHGLQPTRLLCAWDFLGKSTGVGCHCWQYMLLPKFLFGNNTRWLNTSTALLFSPLKYDV